MRAFPTTERDNKREVMRLELSAADVELLDLTVERLDALAKIEEALDVVAIRSPFILGKDTPTATVEGARLLREIVNCWDPDADDGDVEIMDAA